MEGPDAAELQVRRPVPIEGDHRGLEQPRAGDGGRRRARLPAARGAEEAPVHPKGAAQTTACCCVLLWAVVDCLDNRAWHKLWWCLHYAFITVCYTMYAGGSGPSEWCAVLLRAGAPTTAGRIRWHGSGTYAAARDRYPASEVTIKQLSCHLVYLAVVFNCVDSISVNIKHVRKFGLSV
jgi:hypothetical protein